MLFQCDLVYIAEDARLTVPFIDLGVVPENASSMTMVDRLGQRGVCVVCDLGESVYTAATPPLGAWRMRRCRPAKCCRAARAAAQMIAVKAQARCVTPRS